MYNVQYIPWCETYKNANRRIKIKKILYTHRHTLTQIYYNFENDFGNQWSHNQLETKPKPSEEKETK